MKGLFGEKKDPDQQAREAIRRKKWSKAIAIFEQRLQSNERDYALWNLVGDLYAHKRARGQAVESWRRALDGYALEGMYENVLGIGRKILRNAPEENDIYLILADAHLNLDRHADCLGALRTYLKIAKHRSESDLRSLFRHIAGTSLSHAHLLTELESLFRDSGIEDVELEQKIVGMVQSAQEIIQRQRPEDDVPRDEPDTVEVSPEWKNTMSIENSGLPPFDGMMMLDVAGSVPEDTYLAQYEAPPALGGSAPTSSMLPDTGELLDPTGGPGNDHYDLGNVYREMKLWDAAIAEFQQARRDPSLRVRATLSLADCYIETHDLQAALELLTIEAERGYNQSDDLVNIHFRLGDVNELLGNLDAALKHFQQVCKVNPDFGDAMSRLSGVQAKLTQ